MTPKKKRRVHLNHVAPKSRAVGPLLCNRPERIPGVAPHCEGDDLPGMGRWPNRLPVTLPRLRFLEKKDAPPC